MSGIHISPAPSDGVSHVSFSPCGTSLLVATWSGELALHSSTHGALTASASLPCPALAAAYGKDAVYGAGLNGTIYSCALSDGALRAPAALPDTHASAVSCLALCGDGVLASGGWDGVLRLCDVRAAKGAGEVAAAGKVYAVDTVGESAVAVVTSKKRVQVVDRRKLGDFLHDILPSLDVQLRTVSASPRRAVLVVGSADGRVAVESLDGGKNPSFAFKCHRVDGKAYPVNAIVHNKKYGSFATGGGDGVVNVWDGVAKKRLYQANREATSIASLAYSPDDGRMAVAVSYTYEDGERDHPPDTVIVREVGDAEIRTRDAGAPRL